MSISPKRNRIPGGDHLDLITRLPNPGSGGAGGNGGGGGNSYATPNATDVTLIPGVNAGDGKVIVSFRFGRRPS